MCVELGGWREEDSFLFPNLEHAVVIVAVAAFAFVYPRLCFSLPTFFILCLLARIFTHSNLRHVRFGFGFAMMKRWIRFAFAFAMMKRWIRICNDEDRNRQRRCVEMDCVNFFFLRNMIVGLWGSTWHSHNSVACVRWGVRLNIALT